jgi:hypothetical protein
MAHCPECGRIIHGDAAPRTINVGVTGQRAFLCLACRKSHSDTAWKFAQGVVMFGGIIATIVLVSLMRIGH